VEQLPIAGKVAVSAYSLQFYAWKTLVPTGLSPLYAMPQRVDPAAPRYLLSAGAVVAAAAALWTVRRRAPGVAMAALAFAAILFPLLGVHQGGPQLVADRNTYNASFALAVLVGGIWAALRRRSPRLAALAATTIVATLGALTWRQVAVWRDSETLWARVLEVEPGSPLGHNNYGNALIRQGRVGDAMAHYTAAIRAMPAYAEAHTNLGVALAASGRFGEAIAEYRKALEIRPRDDEALNNWGVALSRSGDPQAAIERFTAATTVNPANADAHVNWGNALLRLGRGDEAVARYREALRWRPDHADALFNWGVALAQQGQLTEAIARFDETLRLAPGHQEAATYLARARELLRSDDSARAGGQPRAALRPRSP
jgi:tetratricopeptide (TPR) repeat protein